jgi:MFS family permease
MILMPLYEQGPRMQSAMMTGMLLAPQGLGAAIGAPIAGRLTDRYGGGIVAIFGLTLLTIATLPFTMLSATTPQWLIMIALLFRGMGIGASMMPAMAAAYAALNRSEIPDATSQLNVVQRVGGSLGSAVLAVLLGRRLGEIAGGGGGAQRGITIPLPIRERMADAYAYTNWWVLALGLIALLPATVLFRVEKAARAASLKVAPSPTPSDT